MLNSVSLSITPDGVKLFRRSGAAAATQLDQLKALIAQRTALEAQIAQLQPSVQAVMAEMTDLLGNIQPPAQH